MHEKVFECVKVCESERERVCGCLHVFECMINKVFECVKVCKSERERKREDECTSV